MENNLIFFFARATPNYDVQRCFTLQPADIILHEDFYKLRSQSVMFRDALCFNSLSESFSRTIKIKLSFILRYIVEAYPPQPSTQFVALQMHSFVHQRLNNSTPSSVCYKFQQCVANYFFPFSFCSTIFVYSSKHL